ncbi:hypothetical protein IMCC3317_21530 [Kordia antarctica]|uniref:TIR domain-containing protein n=1 Tax=Kordia antarctica TaxID=1218801 RepID=A0A7L4ZJ94_9FLAO|nr:toll/interleukin-1 receptor domain-containing protein [Kordia antarctica]QHI36783.1 hypothetical protein IMCC3317_21530 [Kordia antarctica]
MSIFISYSHKDEKFVDKLAIKLVDDRIPVFVDRWEINVGDSITNKIENAITDASYLIIVLSKNSVESNWCKREITSGLMLELEKKRVVLLPVLIEECKIPLFLRDKHYADFRLDFETGYEKIKQSVARLKNDELGRIEMAPKTFSDFAISWGIRGEYFEMLIDVVEFSVEEDKPFTILTSIVFVGNKKATDKYNQYLSEKRDWLMKSMVLMICVETESFVESNVYIYGDKPYETVLTIADPKMDISFQGFVTVKRLGPSDKKNKIYYFGNIFKKLWEDERRSVN